MDLGHSLEDPLLRVWFGSSGTYNPSFHIFPALLKSNGFQSACIGGTLRDGLKLREGGPLGVAFWWLTISEAVPNGDCTLRMKCHTDIRANPWEQGPSIADVGVLENPEPCRL